jgi:hypothetical protein
MRREGCFRFVCGSVYVVVCVCVCFACVCFLRGGTEYVRKFACVVVGSGGRQGGGHPGGRWRVESGGACSAPVAADCWLPAGWTLTQGHEVGEGHEVLGQVGAVGAAVGGDDGGAGAGAGGAVQHHRLKADLQRRQRRRHLQHAGRQPAQRLPHRRGVPLAVGGRQRQRAPAPGLGCGRVGLRWGQVRGVECKGLGGGALTGQHPAVGRRHQRP